MKPPKPINRRSTKGKQLDRMDKLQSQILRIKRGPNCEISERLGTCVFHILNKKDYPRLRYYEWNLLWTSWTHAHSFWHHYGPHHPKIKWIVDRIKALRGKNYYSDLKVQDIMHPRMKPHQLDMIELSLKQELKSLNEEEGMGG